MANYAGVTHPWSGTIPRTTPVGYYNGDQLDEQGKTPATFHHQLATPEH
jgi:hypothetical protein